MAEGNCPECGSSNLKRGQQNLWCASCDFFPIPYSTVPFEEDAVKQYLDECIRHWRRKGKNPKACSYAYYYIDAYQSVRVSLFGERLAGTHKYAFLRW